MTSQSPKSSGKISLSLKKNGAHIIRVKNPKAEPYRANSKRARAWGVVSLMDGLTIADAHEILKKLEPNIQGKIGRPLGWVADAINNGNIILKTK